MPRLCLSLVCIACCFALACQDASPVVEEEPPVIIELLDEGFRYDGDMEIGALDLATPEDLGGQPEMRSVDLEDMSSGEGEEMAPEARFAPCSKSLSGFLERVDAEHPGRGEDTFVSPMASRTEALSSSLAAASSGRGDAVSRSAAFAADAGYEVCSVQDDGGELLIWAAMDSSSGDALIAMRLGGATEMILEHPHPFFDGTFAQALPVFEMTRARAMILSGHHRCSSDQASSCDGRTSVCGESSASYPVSDPAHHDEGTFQVAHEVLAERFSQAAVISMHGTAQAVSYTSNGTRRSDGDDPVLDVLVSALEEVFPEIEHRSCDAYDARLSGVWLCGTTNVQGRALRGSPNACTEDGVGSSGRFFHLEQSRAMRDRPADIAAALLRVFE